MSVQAAFPMVTYNASFTYVWFQLVLDFGTLDKE
jgi:hypothetical protein